jgi:hypothetical protein
MLVRGLLPFENTIHITDCESMLVDRVNSVRKETRVAVFLVDYRLSASRDVRLRLVWERLGNVPP